ncbi:MAG: hypothetical protein AAGN64_08430 [Bacteroidota bacterium]
MRCWPLLLALVVAACDRADLGAAADEDSPLDTVVGTFEAEAGSLLGGGYERLEGIARFSVVETAGAPAVLVVRLRSILEDVVQPDSVVVDTSFVDLAIGQPTGPPIGIYPIADLAEVAAATDTTFAACYRTRAFPDGAYRSGAGTVEIVASGERLIGTFDVEVYARYRATSGQVERRVLPITGQFDALAEPSDGLDAAAVFRCRADG